MLLLHKAVHSNLIRMNGDIDEQNKIFLGADLAVYEKVLKIELRVEEQLFFSNC